MKKRHHFVPKFYLKQFASVESADEIWTYDIEAGVCRSSIIENTAFEKHLYSVTRDDGKRVDDLEDMIAGIEDKAAPVLRKLLKGEGIVDQERADFASFIAIMYVRTDAHRHRYAQAMTGGLQVEMYAVAKHESSFNKQIEKLEEERGSLTKEQIEDLRQSMLDPHGFAMSVDKEWTLKALELHDELAPIFFKMNWSFIKADSPRYFITSDNPVTFGVPTRFRHPIYGGGLINKNSELTFPLSAEVCLLSTWDFSVARMLRGDRESVKSINRQRAIHAWRFLFGPRRDSGIEKLGAKFKDRRPGIKISGFGPETFSSVELRRKR